MASEEELQEQIDAAHARISELDLSCGALESRIRDKEASNAALVSDGYVPRVAECARAQHLLALMDRERDHLADFLAEHDADAVRKAVQGMGSDKSTLTFVLCSRSKSQLLAIASAYESKYGESLLQRLQAELSGVLAYFFHVVLTPSPAFDAELLEEAMKGWGTDEDVLTEVLCTRSNEELLAAADAFRVRTGQSLRDAVKGDVSGGYATFLLACLAGVRDTNPVADVDAAAAAAEELHEAMAGAKASWTGGDGSALTRLLARASPAQVEAVKSSYEARFGESLEDAMSAACSGDLRRAVQCRLMPKAAFYAHRLRRAFEGSPGTDERACARVLGRCTRREIQDVMEVYAALYNGASLADDLSAELGGIFERHFREAALLRLFGKTPPGASDDSPNLSGPHTDMELPGVATSAFGSRFDSFEEAMKACVHPSSTAAGITQLGPAGPFTLRAGSDLQPALQGEVSWLRSAMA